MAYLPQTYRAFILGNGNLKFSPVLPPAAGLTTAVSGVAGVLTGSYRYSLTYVTATGETEIGPIAPTVTPSSQRVNITNITVSPDSRVISKRLYRTSSDGNDFSLKLLTTLPAAATSYEDNIADGSLGVNQQENNTTGGNLYLNDTLMGWSGLTSTAFGHRAGEKSRGKNNLWLGSSCGREAINGSANTGAGYYCMRFLVNGNNNVAVGENTGNGIIDGKHNVSIGPDTIGQSDPSYTTVVGVFGARAPGSRVIALGSYAGKYSTSDNEVFVNAFDRVNANGDRTLSLLYGVQGATVADQTLTVNGKLNGSSDIEATPAGSGFIVKSPNGARWRITVSDAGAFASTAL